MGTRTACLPGHPARMTTVADWLIVYINLHRRTSGAAALGLFREDAMFEEFKKFALKGSVVDLAVGVIIGAAFGQIVQSAVGDMIMPLIGAVGGFDFTNYFLPLSKSVTATTLAEAKKQGAVLAWGNFVTACINFLIITWVLFLAIKAMNRLRLHEEAQPAPPPRQEVLLEEIRDLLAKK
jgi:large conductance mechanosensitive channel